MTSPSPDLKALNGTSYNYRGEQWEFWSLAPPFGASFAVQSIPGYQRHFVWLTRGGRFLHAVVAAGFPQVCATKLDHGREDQMTDRKLDDLHNAMIGGSAAVLTHVHAQRTKVVGSADTLT